MAPYACRATSTIVVGVPRRLAFLALVFALLAIFACGTRTRIAMTPTHTTVPGGQQPGVLYAFGANQGPNGPTSTDIYALSLGDGKQLWHTQVSGGGGSAAISGGTLYLGTTQATTPTTPPNGLLQAINAGTGALFWHRTRLSSVVLPLAANSDAVFALSLTYSDSEKVPPTSTLMALSARDGTPLWTASLGNGLIGTSSATLGDGALYTVALALAPSATPGPPQAVLMAVDTHTGKLLWRTPLHSPAPPFGAPVLGDGALYFSEQYDTAPGQQTPPASVIQAIRASDGAVLWSKALAAGVAAGGVVATGGMVCYSFGTENAPAGGIVALHAADGSVGWQTSIPSGGPVPLAADTSAVYALESANAGPTLAATLTAVDVNSGKTLLS